MNARESDRISIDDIIVLGVGLQTILFGIDTGARMAYLNSALKVMLCQGTYPLPTRTIQHPLQTMAIQDQPTRTEIQKEDYPLVREIRPNPRFDAYRQSSEYHGQKNQFRHSRI